MEGGGGAGIGRGVEGWWDGGGGGGAGIGRGGAGRAVLLGYSAMI